MMNTQPETPPESAPQDDDLRYAPPAETPAAEVEVQPERIFDDDAFTPTSDSLDIDAALAAVATLDDMLAEQEAAEQARIAREEAEAQAQAERQARLQNPEMFFPMPPLTTLQRGRIDSVIPALALIAVGGWLTITITSGSPPTPALAMVAILGAIGVSLLVRWLASSRWASGSLFFGIAGLLFGGVTFALVSGQSMVTQWPLLLLALGAAFILTGILTQPRQSRLIFPGLVVIIAGAVAYLIVSGLLPWRV